VERADGIPVRTLQHLYYSLLATAIAAAIALPIGVLIGHTGRGALFAVNLTNLGRAIPSLGIIILMFTLVGFGIVPVLVALIALAVPPIVTNSYIGVRSVDRDVREAAEGMGMRGRQVLWQVELPVAMPLIMAGIRTSAVQVVATATLAAYVGLGGLGRYLIDGLSQRDLAPGGRRCHPGRRAVAAHRAGARPRAGPGGLAGGWPGGLRMRPSAPRWKRPHSPGTTRSQLQRKGRSSMRRIRLGGAATAVAACLALLLAACGGGERRARGRQPAERRVDRHRRLDQLLRAAHPGRDVRRRAQEGRRQGRHQAEPGGPGGRLPGAGEGRHRPAARVQRLGAVVPRPEGHPDHLRGGQHRPGALLDAKGLVALDESPAEDKDGWAVTKETAAKYGLAKISDLKGKASSWWSAGRRAQDPPAGLPGLKKVYGIEDFKEFKALDAGGPLTTSALNKGDIDVGRVFTTQGAIAANNWVLLEEDKPLEPAQNIVPIGRKDAMTDQVKQALTPSRPRSPPRS
jgi:osmoprotectant transport system permease protein